MYKLFIGKLEFCIPCIELLFTLRTFHLRRKSSVSLKVLNCVIRFGIIKFTQGFAMKMSSMRERLYA